MSKRALDIIAPNKKTQDKTLELGNCGIAELPPESHYHKTPSFNNTMHHIFTTLLLLVCISTKNTAQQTAFAQFPGGADAYNRYWQFWTQQRPASCEREASETHIQAGVASDGSLRDIQLVRSSGCPAFDSLCLTAVKAMPRWELRAENGQAFETVLTMTVPLRATSRMAQRAQQPKFAQWVREQRVLFWVPFGRMQAVGALENALSFRYFSGLCMAFEGRKWGVEDLLYYGRGRVNNPFNFAQKEWLPGQKYQFNVVQLGARRVVGRTPKGSVWAAAGLSVISVVPRDFPVGTSGSDFEISSAAPYFGGDWRQLLPFKSLNASYAENGFLYGQVSARIYPWALTNFSKGGLFNVSLNIGILVAHKESVRRY
jgi:hypothetical protein